MSGQKRKPDSGTGLFAALGLVTDIGFTLAAAVGLGMFLGMQLDGFLGTGHILTIVLGVLGAAGGFYSVFKKIVR